MASNSFNGKERRAYVRLQRSLPVRFKISAQQKSKTYTAKTKNISRVDWARKPTANNPAMMIGIEFEGATDEARKRIHEYTVKEMVKRYEEPDLRI
jgi:hypothetical protein